ncbi:MAG: hypothetical protein E7265_00085 [Lachnospiraceae bacterium]|nr:hypothetical protein [Lachnospiraceae bacterium]
MSIRPIDIVTIAPKSQEVSQVQFNEHRGREQANVATNQNFQKTEQHDSRRTVESSKSETEHYSFDAKEGRGGSAENKRKGKKSSANKEEKTKKTNVYGGGFDITI